MRILRQVDTSHGTESSAEVAGLGINGLTCRNPDKLFCLLFLCQEKKDKFHLTWTDFLRYLHTQD